MAKEAGHRVSSLFSFGDRSRSKSPAPPKTLNKPRSSSPAPNQLHPQSRSAANSRPSSSSQNLSSLKDGGGGGDARGRQQPRLSSLMTEIPPPGQGLDDSLQPPPPIAGFGGRSASPSASNRSSFVGSLPNSRPASPGGDMLLPGTPTEGNKLSKRMSWMPGGKHARTASGAASAQPGTSWAFIVGPTGKTPYDTTPLMKAQPIPELWDEQGNMFVHFSDKASGQGPSFKVHSSLIAQSKNLTGQSVVPNVDEVSSHMRHVSISSQNMSRASSASGHSDTGVAPSVLEEEADGLHLYLQLSKLTNDKGDISGDGLELLIKIRNLFAFLVGQVLVGTPHMPSLFAIFMTVAGSLRRYEFSNIDGTTLGEVATSCFLGYVEDLRISDIRASREKTLEALALGERMKCWPLYNEAYVHAAGKWDELVRLKTPVFQAVSETTKTRLERSSRNLQTRLTQIGSRLEKFDFPSLFHGVLASSATSKLIDSKSWRVAFLGMRNHIIGVYKNRYGQWPPKANSNKNNFEIGGLNRIVALEMYQDFCDLYDMLVDRTNFTTRSVDITAAEEESLSGDPAIQTLRKFMSEFDRSSPPVLPPLPYDLPLIPNLGDVKRDFKALNLRKQVKERSKKIKDDDVNNVLMKSYNRDSIKVTPFVESFMAFERQSAYGKTFDEVIDLRIGQWMFLYVILQSLPLLVMDAPGLKWTKDVEYFLCEMPRGSPPWAGGDAESKKSYYRVAGGQGVVSLPADVVEHGVEGIFFRSHCWTKATEWSGAGYSNPATQNGGGQYENMDQFSSAGQYQQQQPPSATAGPGALPQGMFNYPQYPPNATTAHHHHHPSFEGQYIPSPSTADTPLDQHAALGDYQINPHHPQAGGVPIGMVGGINTNINPGSGLAPPTPIGQEPRRSSVGIGLEALPMPPSINADEKAIRRVSTPDPTKSFDAILTAGMEDKGGKKKRRV